MIDGWVKILPAADGFLPMAARYYLRVSGLWSFKSSPLFCNLSIEYVKIAGDHCHARDYFLGIKRCVLLPKAQKN